jgi:sucrose-6-phosphate hydrolase SacC (GH32 family)
MALVTLCGPLEVGGAQEDTLDDKTLVAWLSLADLAQRGGSALTIERQGGVFDAVVFGEIAPGRWMPGSNDFQRTQREQGAFPAETADTDTVVQMAIVYRGRRIAIYRNGIEYAAYHAKEAERFDDRSIVLMGLRHLDAAPPSRFFGGSIEDARIYASALTPSAIAALEPNVSSGPRPLAWWDFEDGRASDRMGTFPTSTMIGAARIAGGRLHLDGEGAYLLASRKEPDAASVGLGNNDASSRALRERLLGDPYRPGYHFVAPEGRCMPFDPNGAIYWKGRYHLFYIFQDKRGHNWGHVSSTDLFHWRHHPTRLVSGMFSGNCFIDKAGRPTMCYHQVGEGNAMAVAVDDELNDWRKLGSNPITPRTREGDPHHGKYRSWDPHGWVEGDTYYAIFGGQRPAVAKATDLAGPWSYVGDLLANPVAGVSIHEDVSCPDLFELDGRHVLLCISHRLGCRYYLGDWRGEAFHPTFHAKMSWIDNSFFAPESLLDGGGRRIMWAWIFDEPGFKTRTDFGWSGTMSLPRVLTLGEDGMLRIRVPEEIEKLRYNGRKRTGMTVGPDADVVLAGIRGNSLELAVEMRGIEATRFGVKVCCAPDGSEQTAVFYDALGNRLTVDTRKSSLRRGPEAVEAGPLELEESEPLRLRVFVDRSVVEVFANDRQAVMRRIYPSRADSIGVCLFSEGGPTRVTALEAWDLMPSNPY